MFVAWFPGNRYTLDFEYGFVYQLPIDDKQHLKNKRLEFV